MVLLVHVIIALTSVIYTPYLFVRPSRSRFYTAYSLVALTLISGTYLVLSTHARMLQSCETGLLYIAGVSVGLVAARHRLLGAVSSDAQATVGMRSKDDNHQQ